MTEQAAAFREKLIESVRFLKCISSDKARGDLSSYCYKRYGICLGVSDCRKKVHRAGTARRKTNRRHPCGARYALRYKTTSLLLPYENMFYAAVVERVINR